MEVSPMATEQPFSFMQMHPDDNAASYEAALRDHLHHEGDIEGELALQKEHFKKLKFNFIEVETKRRFMHAVLENKADEEVGLSGAQVADLEIQISHKKAAASKVKSEAHKAQKELKGMGEQLASGLKQVDALTFRYANEKTWFTEQDKENRDSADLNQPMIQPKSKERCQRALDDQTQSLHHLNEQCQRQQDAVNELEWAIAPLQRQCDEARAEVERLQKRKANSEDYATVQWYAGVRSVLAAITGLDVTCVRGGAEGEAPSVTLMVRSTTAQRAVTHSVAVTFNPSTNRIADVKLEPADVPCDDIIRYTIRMNDLPFLVRELRNRVSEKEREAVASECA